MKKNLLVTLVLALFYFIPTQAQLRLAIYGGLHSASVSEKNQLPNWETSVKPYYSSKSGFHIGFMAEVPLGKGFYFQPSIGYTAKGRQFSRYYDTADAMVSDTLFSQSTLKIGYIEIPLNVTYKFPLSASGKSHFFIGAGPYVGFFYNGSLNTQSRTLSTSKYANDNLDLPVGNAVGKYKTLDLGVNARAGFEFGNVMISGFFSRGLSSFYKAEYDGTFHHQVVGATLGIWLTKAAPAVAKLKPKKDTDKDGVNDDEDACPLLGGKPLYHGCPVPDTDKDGVDDEHDSCRTIAGVARYHGCPVPDTDKDGVDDENDSCKSVAGVARYHGCPVPDRDSDSVNDEQDQCPDVAGSVDNHGCPVIKKEITEQVKYVAKNILFKPSSDKLTIASYAALDSLTAVLQKHPELQLDIAGHTDNSGVAAKNMVLSQRRADAVKAYLISKGIDAARITATGFGDTRPIADNKTNEGKAANRRVELNVHVNPSQR